MPIAMTYNAQKYYLHYDQVGSLRVITDTSHNIVKEISYDTYGNILSDSNEAFIVPFGFAGGLYDTDTKLTRFGYRDYDAYTGKWTAKDPIDFYGGDSNLYGYVLGDPVNFVDPFGLHPNVGPFITYTSPVIPFTSTVRQPVSPAVRQAQQTRIDTLVLGLSIAGVFVEGPWGWVIWGVSSAICWDSNEPYASTANSAVTVPSTGPIGKAVSVGQALGGFSK